MRDVVVEHGMTIPYGIRLSAGQIVMVEFGPDPRLIAPPGVMTGPLGVQPEMFKERHGIVLSTTNGLITIVRLSTKAPPIVKAFHYRISAGAYGGMSTTEDSWTKSDLLTTVSSARVDRPFVGGRRAEVHLSAADLKAVRATVLHALQLGRLVPNL